MQLREPAGANSDRNALTGLFEMHRARLRAMLQRRLDPALAARLGPEDILHKSFLRANDRWPDFLRSQMSAYAWLYCLVRDILNEEYRFHTRQRRDLAKEVPWPDDSVHQLELVLQARRASPSSPSSAAVRHERQERVRQTLASLKVKDQEVLCVRPANRVAACEEAAMRFAGRTHSCLLKAGGNVSRCFIEVFTATARNENTRLAYAADRQLIARLSSRMSRQRIAHLNGSENRHFRRRVCRSCTPVSS